MLGRKVNFRFLVAVLVIKTIISEISRKPIDSRGPVVLSNNSHCIEIIFSLHFFKVVGFNYEIHFWIRPLGFHISVSGPIGRGFE